MQRATFLAEKLEVSSSELSGARPDQSENLLDRRGRRYVKGFIENLTQLVGAIRPAQLKEAAWVGGLQTQLLCRANLVALR
jgi:hypothetical protein